MRQIDFPSARDAVRWHCNYFVMRLATRASGPFALQRGEAIILLLKGRG